MKTLVTALAAFLAVVLPPVAPPSSASSVYLCTGYTGCAEDGYSHAGYAQRNDRMYWRMYSGHNCTNYVAYRMIQAGMSEDRPWSGGSGNAYYWGYAMDEITDRTPAVGAVAWWDRGVPGAGSSGHVAYVEKVVSSTEIVISEDSWSGDFHWRRIYKEGTGWPTGFIHFVDQKTFKTTAAPRIEGTPQVGVPLRGYRAGYTPTTRQRIQWLAGATPIAGATGARFTPTATQVGKQITLRSTTTRQGYVTATSTSAPTAAVAEGVFTRVARPVISGFPEVGETLRATRGTFAPAASPTLQWKADGERLEGEVGSTLVVTRALVDKKITVVSSATGRGYRRTLAVSDAVGPVVEGRVELSTPFVASGTVRYGSTLTYTAGTYTPSDATVSYAWLRDGVVIAGATTSSYALTRDDIGRSVSVQATVSKPRYQSVTSTADFGQVTTPSQVRVTTLGRPGRAVVKVRALAAGLDTPPGGTVTVRIAKHTVTGRLTGGRLRVVLSDLAAGKRVVHVSYSGTEVAEASRATATVRVKREPRR